MNQLLSICIPTYNRATYLIECIQSFIPQVRDHQIPIYVSDNCSTDETLSVLEKIKKEQYPLIFYKSSDNNNGIDQNIIDAVAMATSQYVWLFGDDDIVTDKAVEVILDRLQDNYQLMIVNASTNNIDFTEVIEERHLQLFEDKIYENGDHETLLAETAAYTTFLGSLVIDRNQWGAIDYKPYLKSDFVHSSIVYNYVVGCRAYVISTPYIKIRLQNASWSNRKFLVWMVNWPKTIWSLPETYSDKVKQRIIHNNPIKSIKLILRAKALGWYRRENYCRDIAADVNLNFFYKQLLYLIAIFPEKVIRTLMINYLSKKNNASAKYLLFELRNNSGR